MKKKISIILGVLALILAVGLNVRHAMNDYGVKESKLHIEVLACTYGGCMICGGDPGPSWKCQAGCCSGSSYCDVNSCWKEAWYSCCSVTCDGTYYVCCD